MAKGIVTLLYCEGIKLVEIVSTANEFACIAPSARH